MFTTVTEVNGGPKCNVNAPAVFVDATDAEEYFNDCVRENGAEIVYTDEFSQVAKVGDDTTITLHYQVPGNV